MSNAARWETVGSCYGCNMLFAPALWFTNLVTSWNKNSRKECVVEPELFWCKTSHPALKLWWRRASTASEASGRWAVTRCSPHAARWRHWAGRAAGGEAWTEAGLARASSAQACKEEHQDISSYQEASCGGAPSLHCFHSVSITRVCNLSASWAGGTLRQGGRASTRPTGLCVKGEQGSTSKRSGPVCSYRILITISEMKNWDQHRWNCQNRLCDPSADRQAVPFPLLGFYTSLLTSVYHDQH